MLKFLHISAISTNKHDIVHNMGVLPVFDTRFLIKQ